MSSRLANRLFLACAALSAFGAASAAHADVYTVGTDGACTHTTIAAAAAAADARPGADEIHLVGTSNDLSNPDYVQQAISFSVSANEQLDIVGGFADCSQAASTGIRTIIDGAGGVADPVFRITVATGGLVRMSYLTIQNGDEGGSGKGGGIYFKGDGILELNHAVLTRNTAGYGGGIYAEGTGTNTELVIGTDVSINQNNARFDGGGVVNDGTEMTMIAPDSSIAFNHAPDGRGGGLFIKGGARKAYTYLGSAGFGTSGAIFFNDAKYGGGVAVVHSGGDHEAVLDLFTTDPARPARITSNTASAEGGGVYLGAGFLVAWYADIEDNIAPKGAAIVTRSDHDLFFYGGAVFFNDPANRPSGAIDCPVGKPCGSIAGNAALDDASQPAGGIVQVGQGGYANLYRVTFEDNTGRNVLYGDGGDGEGYQGFATHHVAIVGNTTSGYLIQTGDNGEVKFDNTTIGGNTIAADTVMQIGNGCAGCDQFFRSIIWQPGKTTLQLTAGPPLDVIHDLLDDMVSERTSVDGGNSPNVTVADPRFVDPEHGDYSLRAASPAIDDTSSVDDDTTDLFGNPRDVKLPVVTNLWLRDLGAIERQTLQPLVLNADFDVDLRLWNVLLPGLATLDTTRNASGASGSGSVHIASQANAAAGTRFGALVQCVQLPGPGVYALNGWGHGTGTQVTAGDIAELYWEYRKNGGAGCTDGSPNATGTLVLSRSNSWSKPATPAYIQVTEQDFTSNSSIAVTLVAEESLLGGTTSAWFDGITLGVEGDDRIFANGFEAP